MSGIPDKDCPSRRFCRGPRLAAALLWVSLSAVAAEPSASPANPVQAGADDSFWWSERFDRVRFTTKSTSHYFISPPAQEAAYLFLPPLPPPPGAEIPLGSLLRNGPPADPALAPHLYDLFYPALATRLAADDLPKNLLAQLQGYQAEKVALQDELRAKLAAVKDSDPETARRQLGLFAELQAPRIAALEALAEKLRHDLIPTGRSAAPAADRPPAGSADEAATTPADESRQEAGQLLLAAFYQDGLTTAQRRLLREASDELLAAARAAESAAPVERTGSWLFFFPETARIRLPANQPPLLQRSLADYRTLKDGLKAELRATLREHAPGAARREALRLLAEGQAPRLAALEALAEDIRRQLSLLADGEGPPAPPALPPELAARISAYRRHKVELLRTLHAMLSEPARPAGRSTAPADAAQTTGLGLRESVSEFNRRQTALLGELNRELTEIRRALAEYTRATGGAGDRKSIDDLLRDFEDARQRQETAARYRDYQTAVLLPGLSPGQRRLLFDAALTQLALPLPAGERIR